MSFYEFHVPRRYVQCEDALLQFPKFAALIGKRVLILEMCDPVREEIEGKLRLAIATPSRESVDPDLAAVSPRYARYVPMSERLDALRKEMHFEFMDLGEAVVEEEGIRRVARYVRDHHFDTVAGVGGGRAQDFARALTRFADVRVILVPTLCATNASISTLSVLYAHDGATIREYWRMDNAPDLVLVDTSVLVRNPPRMLAAGIGDIMSTYCEALCNLKMTGNRDAVPDLAVEGVQLAFDLMIRRAPEAMRAVQSQRITPAFENVISMILHNCGPLGMICTTGFAHLLDEVFLCFDVAHRVPHGLRVGFATIPMMRHCGLDCAAYLGMCREVGIPTALEEMGLGGISRGEWHRACQKTLGQSGNLAGLPFALSFGELMDSLFL